jgi:CHAD domain-containing protein
MGRRSIDELTGDTPLRRAALAIVAHRLDPLPDLLAAARAHDHTEPKPVHRLRVATRRADAALDAFRPCFGRRRWKRVRAMLRAIRRAASDARACDVHITMLQHEPAKSGTVTCFPQETGNRPGFQTPVIRHALDRVIDARAAAQDEVEAVADRFPPARMRKRISRLLASARRSEGTLADAAHHVLPRFERRVDKAAARDLTVLENLHGLRVACKRLRYAVEVFAPCGETRPRTVALKAVQERLGQVNDEHEIAARLDAMAETPAADGLAPGLVDLATTMRARRDAERDAFLAEMPDVSGTAPAGPAGAGGS